MNIYKITTRPEWNPEPSYHAGRDITCVFKGTNSEFHDAITKIEEVESGLSYGQVYNHELPISMSLAGG